MKTRAAPIVLLFLIHCLVQVGRSFPNQEERLFRDVCDGCRVSNNVGFNSHDEDCSCYYTCVMQTFFVKPSVASPWISYKRCCPCGQTFSMKLLTCVDYRDKRSDCYDVTLFTNPCAGVVANSLVTRSNPDDASPSSAMCSGFHTCVSVGDNIVPLPGCCSPGTCFDPVNVECSSAGCQEVLCSSLTETQKRDCECDVSTDLSTVCIFQEDPNDNTRFMGGEYMRWYQCPDGTCWDQSQCSCITVDTSGNDACIPFAILDFDEDNTARDGQGNTIWTEASEEVNTTLGDANFDGSGGTISIGGLSNTYLSNTYILHFKFVLRDDDSSSSSTTQCIVGDCLDELNSGSTDSFAITVVRDSNSDGVHIILRLTYQNVDFMTHTGGMQTQSYTIMGIYRLGVMYDFWLIYCGDHDEIVAGVLDQESEVVGLVSEEIFDSRQLIPPPSGFVFGDCLSGEPFEGSLDDSYDVEKLQTIGGPCSSRRHQYVKSRTGDHDNKHHVYCSYKTNKTTKAYKTASTNSAPSTTTYRNRAEIELS